MSSPSSKGVVGFFHNPSSYLVPSAEGAKVCPDLFMQRRKYTSFSPRLLPKTNLAHQKTRKILFPEAFLGPFFKTTKPNWANGNLEPWHGIPWNLDWFMFRDPSIGFSTTPYIQLGSSWSPRANNQGQLVIAQITKKLQSVQKAAGVLDRKKIAQWNGRSRCCFFP